MTSSSDRIPVGTHDPALRAAIQWSIQLDERPDDAALRQAFDRWLAEHPDHRAAWSHAGRVLGLIGRAGSAAPASLLSRTRPWRGVAVGTAAAAVALLAVLAPRLALRWEADHVTGTAQQQGVALADGSTVRLAPGSAIRVTDAATARGVHLLAGEAFFEVARDSARPFQVTARTARVTVEGTGFNIRLGDGGTDVAVKHGRVRVDSVAGQPSRILTDGQWARVDRDGATAGGSIAPTVIGSWASERLIAVDQPLSEVIADLRRYYDGVIIVTDSGLGRRIVTGSYDIRDPAAAAGVIVGAIGGTVTQVTPWLLIVSPT